MFTSFRIQNFRSIKDFTLDELARMTLIVGPNNVGKTTLMEAIWLLHGATNTPSTLSLASFRGQEPSVSPEQVWYPLFREMKSDVPIQIEGKEDGRGTHSLSIALLRGLPQTISTKDASAATATATAEAGPVTSQTIQFEYRHGKDDSVLTTMTIAPDQIQTTVGVAKTPAAVFLAARRETNAKEMARRYTLIDEAGRLDTLVESLAVLQPGLKSVSLAYSDQSQPFLRARIGSRRPIPLMLFGGGTVRLAEIILAIAAAPGGTVLIDEIDNGLYYENLSATLASINRASIAEKTQVIATTHSAECVRAFVGTFATGKALDERDFRLIRLERSPDGVGLRAGVFDYEQARTAMDMGLEVR